MKMPFHDYFKTVVKKAPPQEYVFHKGLCKQFKQYAQHWFQFHLARTTGELDKRFHWNHNEYSQFSQLAYFGLIKKRRSVVTGKDTDKYVMTSLGEEFFLGEMTIPDRVVRLDGEIIGPGHEAWDYHYGRKVQQIHIWEAEERPKTREEWKEETRIALGYHSPILLAPGL